MSAHDDLTAAMDALSAEKTDRESKVSAIREALKVLQSAVDALDGAAGDSPVAGGCFTAACHRPHDWAARRLTWTSHRSGSGYGSVCSPSSTRRG